MTEVEIRPLLIADTDDAFAVYQAASNRASFPVGPVWKREQIAPLDSSGLHSLGLVAVLKGEVVAFILYSDVGAAFEISMPATDPKVSRQGLMTQLLRELQSQSTRLAHKKIWLEVHEKNAAARGLYERLGFLQVGRRPRYYSDGGAAILYNYG